ncbi:TRAP transporter substrate-binding protein DctP [Marinobacter sp. 1_MG-2023]|uniref:TRAP transporter substrate-binding protein DctP n=1 Tax=Marinobacter sp. 1_MG-2023 TaxID=3062627 RepID=UPI0026E40F43|nr:TRAP transporter substrate-binding protein DctP [Marinobacter sp. 1_MG-2023]MDO6822852.1 TRAP transporter substrate-binding protein DctP [Marinobacter sp. 1_MG-2023]
MWVRPLVAMVLIAGFSIAWKVYDRIPVQVVGQQHASGSVHIEERKFFEDLAETTDLPLEINYTPVDTLGFKDTHQLIMLREGALDLVSLRFPQNAWVEPALLGVDLLGGAVDVENAYAIMQAYAPALDRRLQDRFNVKLLGMWPFGPQVFVCRTPVESLQDFEGLRIRVSNETFSPLIEYFGASPVIMLFEDVQMGLRSGLIDCAISSAASANAAGWPEYATHFFRLRTQAGVNGYVINLSLWNRLSRHQQERLEQAFEAYVDAIWASVEQLHLQFSACNTGQPCQDGTPYNLVDVEPSEQDYQLLGQAFKETVFPKWAQYCDELYPGCSDEWQELVEPVLIRKSGDHQ